jgi:hypothetical protein
VRLGSNSLVVSYDPGYVTGRVWLEPGKESAIQADQVDLADAIAQVGTTDEPWHAWPGPVHVLIEDMHRVQDRVKQGPLLDTLRQVGGLQALHERAGRVVHRLPRSWVVRCWHGDVSDAKAGKTTDARIAATVGQLFGNKPYHSKSCRRKRAKSHGARCDLCGGTGYEHKGALSHVSGHARQALALALAWMRYEHPCCCYCCAMKRPWLEDAALAVVKASSVTLTVSELYAVLESSGYGLTSRDRLHDLLRRGLVDGVELDRSGRSHRVQLKG